MKKKRNNNIYIPKPGYEQSHGNSGKPNLNTPLIFNNPEYDKFLRRQQQLKTRRK